MKLNDPLRHLRRYSCTLSRNDASHALWINPVTAYQEAIPRHMETGNVVARKICRCLSVPEIGRGKK